MSISQKFVVLLFSTVLLSSCGKTLDYTKIETQIRDGIAKEGGSSLKSVICPTDVKPEAGRTFECVGVLDSKVGFAIPVKQQDDKGTVLWDVASVKGLLNMTKLQDEFAQGLKKEVGEAKVDCSSGAYRAAKPGESFECKLVRREEKAPIKVIGSPTEAKPNESDPAKPVGKAKEEDAIQVTIQPNGDINWQRIIKVPASQIAALPPKEATDKDKPESTQKDAVKDNKPATERPPEQSASTPAAKSANDFLKQPGAADDFE